MTRAHGLQRCEYTLVEQSGVTCRRTPTARQAASPLFRQLLPTAHVTAVYTNSSFTIHIYKIAFMLGALKLLLRACAPTMYAACTRFQRDD